MRAAGDDRGPPGQWRLLAPAAAGWAVCATVLPHPGATRWAWVGAVVLAGAALLSFAARRHPRPSDAGARQETIRGSFFRHGAVCCAVLLLLAVRIGLDGYARDAPELAVGGARAYSVTLDGYPETRETVTRTRFWVRADCLTGRGPVPVLLWLDEEPEAGWAPGRRLSVRAKAARLEPGSSAAYGLSVAETAVRPAAGPSERLGALAASLRAGLRDAAARVDGAALVPGFAVGDTSLVDERLERNMLQSSLTHLVAVSGANCALVTSAVMWFASRLGAGRRLRRSIAAAALLGFVGAVGPDASVQRAALMAAVVLVSGYGGKRSLALPSLGAAMLVMLCLDPWQALQPGFALSVAATAGILLIVPTLQGRLHRVPGLPGWISLPVAVALAAQLACGPLLLLLQPGLPAAGVLANVIAAPAAPLGTGAGLLALVLLPLAPPAGHLALQIASLAARWVEATAEVLAEVPLARLPWPGGWAGAVLLATVEAAVLLACLLAAGLVALPGGARAPARTPWGRLPIGPLSIRSTVSLLACAAVGVSLGTTVVAPLAVRIGTPQDWSVVACDIGQGDALLFRDPAHPGEVMLIDTGDDEELLDACLDRFGVVRIALLVLSHDDRDHVGALGAVSHRVDAALVAPDNLEDGPERPVLRRLQAARIPYEIGAAGMEGGPLGLRWRILAPDAGSVPPDTNGASIVMRIDAGGIRVLALADTGREQHRTLLEGGEDLSAQVVKVAHHGSRDEDPELLRATGAEIGLVSVGADNRYGHPAPETLRALSDAGLTALRTDELGSVALSPATGEDGSIEVWVERGARASSRRASSRCSRSSARARRRSRPDDRRSRAAPRRRRGRRPRPPPRRRMPAA